MQNPNRTIFDSLLSPGGPLKAAKQKKPGQEESRLAATPITRRAVRFEVEVPQARSISVVGNFNDWKPEATPLTFIGGTNWSRELSLAPGRYEYRFVVDGRWVDPPNAKAYVPNPRGGHNAIVEV